MKNPFKKKDPLAPSRYTGMVKGMAKRTRRSRGFGWLRIFKNKWVIAGTVVLLVFGGLAGYGIWYYYSLQGALRDPGVVLEEAEDEEPFNALLVGSDSRAGLTEEEQLDLGADDVNPDGTPIVGERADTLILAHVDPETNKVTMVQFPRDLYVEHADGELGKISEALQDGRKELVRTVEGLTGLTIHQYAQVNIAGFRDVVDLIGGVEVCIPEAIPFDSATGIEVKPEEVGMVHFDGDRAIRFVRSRKVFAEGDFARIQNQQKFLAAAINKITNPLTFLNFGKLQRLKSIAGQNVKIDANTDLLELYDLLKRFRAFDPNNYEAYTAPNFGSATTDTGLSIVEADFDTLAVMFDAIAGNTSPAAADNVPDIDPSTIRVGIYNGTGEDGAASSAVAELEAATLSDGSTIDVTDVGNAPRSNYKRTIIRFEPDDEREKMAEFVAAALPGAKLVEADTPLGIDVEVIVGRTFETTRIVQIRPLPLPVPGDLPAVCRN